MIFGRLVTWSRSCLSWYVNCLWGTESEIEPFPNVNLGFKKISSNSTLSVQSWTFQIGKANVLGLITHSNMSIRDVKSNAPEVWCCRRLLLLQSVATSDRCFVFFYHGVALSHVLFEVNVSLLIVNHLTFTPCELHSVSTFGITGTLSLLWITELFRCGGLNPFYDCSISLLCTS